MRWWGINHTRRDEHLARDITYTDCQMLFTEPRHQDLIAPVLGQLDLPGGVLVSSRFTDTDDPPAHMGESLDDALDEVAGG